MSPIYSPPPSALEHVVGNPDTFPHEAVRGAKTGLCVFAAEWHGRQDAKWLAEAGVQTTCIDLNRTKLDEMQRIYPAGWRFEDTDAFTFVDISAHNGLKWDVVTADPFTGGPMDRCHKSLDRWCRLANNAVVMGSTVLQTIDEAPAGWAIADKVYRGDYVGGVFWTVLKPC